ncbi:acyltransferase family protein [Emcibacter sp.]|uniref:acyltransferase family protein n=1 Tax=Emcibacter sp. TaxID=1979954 RepID=UPI003A95572A
MNKGGLAFFGLRKWPETKELPRRIYSYDLLRGLCAIFVALYHFLFWTANTTSYVSPLGAINNAGTYGVYMFFMLSGATMCSSYRDRLKTSADFVYYYGVRWARILPLYFFVMMLTVLSLYFIVGEKDWSLAKIILNSSLLFGFGMPGETSNVGGGWSIGIEVVFYTVFPMLLFLMDTKSWKFDLVLLLTACFVQITFVNYVVAINGADFHLAWDYYTNFLSFAGYFVFGCMVSKWLLPRRQVSSGFAILIVFILTLGFVFYPTSGSGESVSGYSGFVFLIIAFAVFLLWSMCELPVWLRGVGSFLGDISYSVYLLHPFCFKGVELVTSRLIDPEFLARQPWVVIIVSMILTIIAAKIVYVVVEKPMLAYFKTRLKKQLVAAG